MVPSSQQERRDRQEIPTNEQKRESWCQEEQEGVRPALPGARGGGVPATHSDHGQKRDVNTQQLRVQALD